MQTGLAEHLNYDCDWNGVLAAPTLANVDSDIDLEIVLNTACTGVEVKNLPNTANAQIFWGTGRGSYLRNGALLNGDLRSSNIMVDYPFPSPGDTVNYSIHLHATGVPLPDVSITNTLPATLTFSGNLVASQGAAQEAGGTITWQGEVEPGSPITISYSATIDGSIVLPTIITNPVTFDDGQGYQFVRTAALMVNSLPTFLPQAFR